ncbi:NAD(P)H-dependent oxidoreductase [Streptomyces sp. NPDC016845]|uniref:NAD(P)H-dependent oxidoreductase n=1 Tax=Streptomyces sp. NPDC016845 TaxID=3364972 RepID=UPI0037946371
MGRRRGRLGRSLRHRGGRPRRDRPADARRTEAPERAGLPGGTRPRVSELIDRAAEHFFGCSECDRDYNTALKNALDHLFREWRGKPVILVGYGGVAAGAGAARALEPVLTALQPQVVGCVPIPDIDQLLHPQDDGRVFRPTAPIEHGLTTALDALRRVLRPERTGAHT